MDRQTGPVRMVPTTEQHGWWQPRPSGAWSAPGYGQPGYQAGAQGGTGEHAARPGVAGGTTTGTSVFGAYRAPGTGGLATAAPPAAPPARNGSRRTSTIAIATALALVAGFGGGYVGSQVGGTSSGNAAQSSLLTAAPASVQAPAPAGSVQEVAAKVLPSTVSVLASSNQSAGEGSGIILTADGLILTNNHVIAGATDIQVRFNDGTTATAEVVGADATDDLAVLRADGVSGLSPATLGSSSDLVVGQPVVAIGSPLGLSATVTSGIVSALNRPVRTASADQSRSAQDTVMNAVQTDAAINPGNSGGALVDMSGNVIGINSAIASLSSNESGEGGSIGVGFAIPIDQAKRIAQEIIDTGSATHAVLGASVGDATSGNSQIPDGAELAQITPGSGAEAAGLKTGDVVVKVGGQPIESADALIAAIRSQEPNGSVDVTFVRGTDTQTVSVTLGSATAN